MNMLFDLRQKLRSHQLGIRPAARKQNTLRSRIMPSPVPPVLELSMGEHVNAGQVNVKVNPNQSVQKYEVLATLDESGDPVLFAPTSGRIVAISDKNDAIPCIRLESDGEDRAVEIETPPDYRSLSHRELLAQLTRAGIMDCGEFITPLAKNLEKGISSHAELLVINAMECEPDVTANESLLREFAAEVVAGAEILQAASLTSRCLIAISSEKTDAIIALQQALEHSSIELQILPARYPAGNERVLTRILTGLHLDWRQQPQDAGAIICDASSAFHAKHAIIDGLPMIHRVITIGGAAVRTPKNFMALIGTPISYLLDLCGIDREKSGPVILGNSMTGAVLDQLQQPVTQVTSCVIATTPGELEPAAHNTACINCGLCASACAAELDPAALYGAIRRQDPESLQEQGMLECILCGACAWVCPSRLPLLDLFRASREELVHESQGFEVAGHWQQRFEYLQYRRRKQSRTAAKKKPGRKKQERGFSREKARAEIAAAVSRVKARRDSVIASSANKDSGGNGDG